MVIESHFSSAYAQHQERRLSESFRRVSADIEQLRIQIRENARHAATIQNQQQNAIERLSAEIDALKNAIASLAEESRLLKDLQKISQDFREFRKNFDFVAQQMIEKRESATDNSRINQGQVRDNSRTSQGQLKDNSNTPPRPSKTNGRMEQVKVSGSGLLTPAEQEIVMALYDSERPLSYEMLASSVNKKPKSVRNSIYTIRKKGIPIRSGSIGQRRIGFYLDTPEKLRISGR